MVVHPNLRGGSRDPAGDGGPAASALDPPPPHVSCESTDVARPWAPISALAQDDRFFLRRFVVVVDALNLHRDFADGRVFTGEAAAPEDAALQRAAELLAEQLVFASAVVLTKVDLLPRRVVDAQVRTRPWSPAAC